MQGIFQKENTDKALKYGIYRHLPTYEKIIRNLVSFYAKKHPVPTAITYTVFCGNAFFRLQSIHAGSDSFFYIGPVIYMENFKGTGI